MKLQLSLLFVISMAMSPLVNATAITQEDVTPMHITVIKNAIELGCKHRGREVGDAPAKVDTYCGCVSSELNKAMSDNDWKNLVVYATSNRTAEKDQLLKSKMASNTRSCKK